MKKSNHQGKILLDHKKVGNKLIPPFLQLSNLKEMSFRSDILPCLIWLSAILLREPDKKALHNIIQFLIECDNKLGQESPPLGFLSNFEKLGILQKNEILEHFHNNKDMLNFIRKNVVHQYHLLKNYPLSFLFNDYIYGLDKEEAIGMLKEDVDALLDRRSIHATKVQTTAFVSMTATRKISLSSTIKLPDFNAVFKEPDSEEGRRAASFVRANINSGLGFNDIDDEKKYWSDSFWNQVFSMERCT